MQKQITLEVAADEFAHAKQAVLQAGFKLEEYLNIILRAIVSSQPLHEDVIERTFHLLPDDLVMQLAKAQMAPKDDQRFSRLLEKQGEGKLSGKERGKLNELSEAYERGTLRKAYAMAEAVRRGLMPPRQS